MIDAWTDPSNPPNPQQFPRNYERGDGIAKLLDKIKGIETNLREVTSNLLRTAGIRLTQLGMFIDSSLTVGGSLDVTGPMVVGGTLSLPAGIIGNDALTSPVEGDVVFATATNFALATTVATLKTAMITVPAGMTSAAISIISRVYAINNNTTGGMDTKGGDWIYSRATVAGNLGNAFPLVVSGSNSSGINVSPLAVVLRGLVPGATFTVTVQAWSGDQAFAANAVNTAEISGSVLWLR